MHMLCFSLSHNLCYQVAFCIDHLGLILMPMNLNLKCYLDHVIYTSSAYQVCGHMFPVACWFLDCKVLNCCFGQIVFRTCIECMCWTVAPFEHALYEICLVLHVDSWYLVASMFWVCFLDACMHFASMPCLTFFAHIF